MRNKIWLVLMAAGAIGTGINAMAQPMSEETADKERIHRLEAAFYPGQPDRVAKFYAKAIMDHNGALQFMVLSPELRQKFRATLEGSKWVTGATNLQITGYGVVNIEQTAKLWKFAIHFDLEYAGGRPYSCVNHIEVAQVTNTEFGESPIWAITKLEFLDPAQACQPVESQR